MESLPGRNLSIELSHIGSETKNEAISEHQTTQIETPPLSMHEISEKTHEFAQNKISTSSNIPKSVNVDSKHESNQFAVSHKESNISKLVPDNLIHSNIDISKKNVRLLCLGNSMNKINSDLKNNSYGISKIRNALVHSNSSERIGNTQRGIDLQEKMQAFEGKFMSQIDTLVPDPKLNKQMREVVKAPLDKAIINTFRIISVNSKKIEDLRKENELYGDPEIPDPAFPPEEFKKIKNEAPLTAAEKEYTKRPGYQEHLEKVKIDTQKIIEYEMIVNKKTILPPSEQVLVRTIIKSQYEKEKAALAIDQKTSPDQMATSYIRNNFDDNSISKVNALLFKAADSHYNSFKTNLVKYENSQGEEKNELTKALISSGTLLRSIVNDLPSDLKKDFQKKHKDIGDIGTQLKNLERIQPEVKLSKGVGQL